MKLSDKILALRKKEGMSQEDLAERLHVSRQAVSRWEMGSAQPEASNILQLSRLFGVTADYLLDDGQEVPATVTAPEGGKNRAGFVTGSEVEKEDAATAIAPEGGRSHAGFVTGSEVEKEDAATATAPEGGKNHAGFVARSEVEKEDAATATAPEGGRSHAGFVTGSEVEKEDAGTVIAPEGGTSPGIPGENPGMEGSCGVAAGEGGHGSRHHAADVKTGGKAKEKCRYRIIGWCAALTGLLGNFVIYVLSRMHKVMVPRITYNGAGQPTYYWSSEIMGYSYKYFVSQHRLQLLVTFFWGMAVTGLLAALLLPYIKSKAES